MVTSVYQLSVIPPNPVHIHPEAQEGQACGLGNQSPSSLACRSDFELRGQEDLKGKKKNHLIHIDAATSISKDNSCGPRLLFFFSVEGNLQESAALSRLGPTEEGASEESGHSCLEL